MLDPTATNRRRIWIGLDDALTARPRHLGYADVAAKLGADAVSKLGAELSSA